MKSISAVPTSIQLVRDIVDCVIDIQNEHEPKLLKIQINDRNNKEKCLVFNEPNWDTFSNIFTSDIYSKL